MKFTLESLPYPQNLLPLVGTVNNLPLEGMAAGTLFVESITVRANGMTEVIVKQKKDGYIGEFKRQSFKVLERAKRAVPGRPRSVEAA